MSLQEAYDRFKVGEERVFDATALLSWLCEPVKTSRFSPEDARAHGFIVDDTCYPWFGYAGRRFAPTASVEVYTDLEVELLGPRYVKPTMYYDCKRGCYAPIE